MVADTTPDFYATMATIIRVLFLAFGASGGFSATSRVWGLLGPVQERIMRIVLLVLLVLAVLMEVIDLSVLTWGHTPFNAFGHGIPVFNWMVASLLTGYVAIAARSGALK
jgi:hypothetical protein